jgi:hypothetical protein
MAAPGSSVGFVAKLPATHQRQSAAKLLNHKDKFQ